MTRSSRQRCLALLVSLPLAASAGSNLEGGTYPEPGCGKRPKPPPRPDKFETVEALDAYNGAVDRYNEGLEDFVVCVQTYVDRATADIRLIRMRIEDAVRTANH